MGTNNPRPEGDSHFFPLVARTMRWHLLWYVPLGGCTVTEIVWPNMLSGFGNLGVVARHFSWILFFSPSAYVCLGSVFGSVILPIVLFLMIPGFFEHGMPVYGRRYLASFGIILAIVLSALLLQVVIWGSFPLANDDAGYVHVRMIPFIPWPSTSPFKQ